jgi:hypothetical protein
MCDLLTIADNKLIMMVLETLENILTVGELLAKAREEKANPFTIAIEEADGLDKIESLQSHDNAQIYEKAVKILETFFGAEAEIENLAPSVAPNQQSFVFSSNVETPRGGFAF